MPENESSLEIKGSNAKCRNCGGSLTFDPASQDLHCPNCDSHFAFDKARKQIKHRISEGKAVDRMDVHDKWASEMKVVKCQTCGAEVMLSGLEVSTACPYCGSDYVSETKALPGLKPDVVIPFAFNEEKAAELFVKGMKKKFFAHQALKKKLPPSKIHGIYVPSFTFDADSVSRYDGRLYKNKTYTDSKGNSHTRREYFKISGTESLAHRDYVEESSTKMNDKQMTALLPYQMDGSYQYDSNFIRGYSLEHYQDGLAACYDNAQTKMRAAIRSAILNQYNHDGVDYLNIDARFSNELYSYRVLPVYSFEFLWKKKNYMVFMNGQTGKVGSQYPKSALKISILVILIVLVVAAIITLMILK